MKLYQIDITSKNKKSIDKFITFFKHSFKSFNYNLKYFEKKRKKKILTILKSPHVNKKAQEQFQITTYRKSFNIFIPKNQQLLVFLKTIKTNISSDVTIKIKFINSNKLLMKNFIQILSPSNFKLKIFKSEKNKVFKFKNLNYKEKYNKINQFFNRLDIYGDLILKSSDF